MGKRDMGQPDDLTGMSKSWQRAHADEAHIHLDGRFNSEAFNALHVESCDVFCVNSMAGIFGYQKEYFRQEVLPNLDFVLSEYPFRASCTTSLQAAALDWHAKTRERQREGGRHHGRGMPPKTNPTSGTAF